MKSGYLIYVDNLRDGASTLQADSVTDGLTGVQKTTNNISAVGILRSFYTTGVAR